MTKSRWRRRIPKILRPYYRAHVFRAAMKRLMCSADPARIEPALLADLHYGWGNEGWSATGEYLTAMLSQLASDCRHVLECGSGLSTILLGVVAQRRGVSVDTLEHHGDWAERVRKTLAEFGLSSVRLHVAPLQSYGEFSWYAVPADMASSQFDVVVCDGPPGGTPGGRYGLVPVMLASLVKGTRILVDDVHRDDERLIAERWARDLGGSLAISRAAGDKAFATLTLPALAPTPSHAGERADIQRTH